MKHGKERQVGWFFRYMRLFSILNFRIHAFQYDRILAEVGWEEGDKEDGDDEGSKGEVVAWVYWRGENLDDALFLGENIHEHECIYIDKILDYSDLIFPLEWDKVRLRKAEDLLLSIRVFRVSQEGDFEYEEDSFFLHK